MKWHNGCNMISCQGTHDPSWLFPLLQFSNSWTLASTLKWIDIVNHLNAWCYAWDVLFFGLEKLYLWYCCCTWDQCLGSEMLCLGLLILCLGLGGFVFGIWSAVLWTICFGTEEAVHKRGAVLWLVWPCTWDWGCFRLFVLRASLQTRLGVLAQTLPP